MNVYTLISIPLSLSTSPFRSSSLGDIAYVDTIKVSYITDTKNVNDSKVGGPLEKDQKEAAKEVKGKKPADSHASPPTDTAATALPAALPAVAAAGQAVAPTDASGTPDALDALDASADTPTGSNEKEKEKGKEDEVEDEDEVAGKPTPDPPTIDLTPPPPPPKRKADVYALSCFGWGLSGSVAKKAADLRSGAKS